MEPRIEILNEKKLIGMRIVMSFSSNKTSQLWRSFMPRRKEIKNNIGDALYSVDVCPPNFFTNFNPTVEYEKWATVEVTDLNTIPVEMESLTIPGGLYAVFTYIGPASEGAKIYRYILETWLPASDFQYDDRANFAVMGEKYKGEAPDSEEEIWIPVKEKNKSG